MSKLILSTYDDIQNPHYGGGGAIAVHKIAKHLSKTYDVTVITWDYCGKKKELIEGVTYERFGFAQIPPKIGMVFFQLLLPLQLMTKKFDLWLESYCPPFTTAMLPLFTRKPVIGIVHMLASEDMERKYKLPFHIVEKFGLRLYKHIIVTSIPLKAKVQTFTKKAEIAVISNGIDKVFSEKATKKNYVLFLGRIEVDQKGLDLLIPAFRRFNKKMKNNYTLVIAGDGDQKEIARLKNIIQKEQIVKAVRFVGRVSGKTKTQLIREAACLVVPSRFETFSLVSLEAFAHNTSLVCFSIKGLSWIPAHLAVKVKPFSIAGLAKALETITSDKGKHNKLITEGNSYARQFTWKSVSRQYDKLIRSTMSSVSSYITYFSFFEL